MAILDGKYLENHSVSFDKLTVQPVSQLDFENEVIRLQRTHDASIHASEEGLLSQIHAGVGVEGAAYAPFHPFLGAENSPAIVNLSRSMGTTDYVVVIQPCVKSDSAGMPHQGIPSELTNIGTVAYRIVDDQNVAVYNTGASTKEEVVVQPEEQGDPVEPVEPEVIDQSEVGFTIIAFRKMFIAAPVETSEGSEEEGE